MVNFPKRQKAIHTWMHVFIEFTQKTPDTQIEADTIDQSQYKKTLTVELVLIDVETYNRPAELATLKEMTCKGFCENDNGDRTYGDGRKYCSSCGVFMWCACVGCPCYGHKLRTRPGVDG